MSSMDKNASLKKKRKRNSFSIAIRSVFGCVLKNKSYVEKIEKEYVSVSCQYDEEKLEEKEPQATCYLEEEQVLLEPKAKLDIAVYKENEISPLTEEFRISLNKLDKLISTLNDIHDIYKNNSAITSRNEQIQEYVHPGEDSVGSGEAEEEHLKFNINFDKNTFIQCHTNRGKHSLKIIHNSCQPNINPLILHRCDSEFLMKKKNHEINKISQCVINNRKYSSETCQEKLSHQLQRSNHTLSSHFGGPVISLATFKSSLIDHMKNLKEDVNTLRRILYSVEYIINREDKPILPFSFGEIRKWFIASNHQLEYNIHDDKSLVSSDQRFTKAKIRASHFCKFYTLRNKSPEKRKMMKHKKK